MTLECNGLQGDWTFDEAEERAAYLELIGRAVPSSQWVTGLVRQQRQDANASFLKGFLGGS